MGGKTILNLNIVHFPNTYAQLVANVKAAEFITF